MADSNKNILITPNVGVATETPSIVFTGFENDPMTLNVTDGVSGGNKGIEIVGSEGQVFNATPELNTGSVFRANDVSGLPMIEAKATGEILLNQLGQGNVGIGTSSPDNAKLEIENTSDAQDILFRGLLVHDTIGTGVIEVTGSNDNNNGGYGTNRSGAAISLKNADTAASNYSNLGFMNATSFQIAGIHGVTTTQGSTGTTEGHLEFWTRDDASNYHVAMTLSEHNALVVSGVISATGGNSTNWNTAHTDRLKWDGGATDLTAATGRTSLGLTGDVSTHTHSSYLTSLGTAIVDADFGATAGFCKVTGSGSYTVDTNTYLTSLGTAIVDADFGATAGFCKVTGSGSYTVDTNTYLTAEVNNLSTVTGTLGIGNGGTGGTTAALAASALGVGTEDSPQFSGASLVNTGNWSSLAIRTAQGIEGAAHSSIYFDGADDQSGNCRYGTIESYIIENTDTSEHGRLSFSTVVDGIDTEYVHITSGNLGVGTTTPTDKFEVHGTSGELLSVADDLSGVLFSANDISGLPVIEAHASGNVILSEYSGNVGIGTASPTELLEVNGSILVDGFNNSANGIFFRPDYSPNGSSGQYNVGIFTADHNNDTNYDGLDISAYDGIRLHTGSNIASPKLTIHQNGNVGIGIIAPTAQLEVKSHTTAGTSGIALENHNGYGYLARMYEDSSDGHFELYQGTNTTTKKVHITSYGDTYFNHAGTGRVGIGTASPGYTLDVDGDINFTGTLYGALTSQTITSSATVPGSPSANDFWYNPNDGSFYIYYNDGNSSQWVQILTPVPTFSLTDLTGISDGADGQFLQTDGAGVFSFEDTGGPWTSDSSSFTATTGGKYLLDTTFSAITVTLPTSPTLGDEVRIVDFSGHASTNNITMARNGQNIQGLAQDMIVGTDRAGFTFVFSDANNGWVLAEK